MAVQTIFLGGGCFWCLEAVFQKVVGVQAVVSGYMGGHVSAPDYESVCQKKTGHAEVVRVDFDDNRISVEALLEIFFTVHDPTTLNRQGNDVGPQYRSVVFLTTETQVQTMQALVARYAQEKKWPAPVVTERHQVAAAQWKGETNEVDKTFWPAEAYHQNYFRRNPSQGYCVFVVNPKVIKAETAFPGFVQ